MKQHSKRPMFFGRIFLKVFLEFIGSRALSFKRPLLSLNVEFCLSVCVFVRNFEVKYLGNKRS